MSSGIYFLQSFSVELTILDITGKEIKKIVNERQSAGLHRVA